MLKILFYKFHCLQGILYSSAVDLQLFAICLNHVVIYYGEYDQVHNILNKKKINNRQSLIS